MKIAPIEGSGGVVHVRNANGSYQLGDALVSSRDWGVKGHVFYTYDAGAWITMVDGAEAHLEEGDAMVALGAEEALRVAVGPGVLGLTLGHDGRPWDLEATAATGVGTPLEAKGEEEPWAWCEMPALNPDLQSRAQITTPLVTGLMAIDALTPVGYGQSMLLHGPKETGMAGVAMEAILAQRDTPMYCIYVALGKAPEEVQAIQAQLRAGSASDYTTVVTSLEGSGPVETLLACNVACSVGDSIRHAGGDVLMVYDELATHIEAFSTLHQQLEPKMPAAMLHAVRRVLYSSILQRCGPLKEGGSMSALAVMETPPGEPTEMMSITDGHLTFTADLYHQGQRPAIDINASLSRIGTRTRAPVLNTVAKRLRMELMDAQDSAAFAGLGGGGASAYELRVAERMLRVRFALRQRKGCALRVEEQAALLLALTQGLVEEVPVGRITAPDDGLVAYLRQEHRGLLQAVADTGMGGEAEEALRGAIGGFAEQVAGEA